MKLSSRFGFGDLGSPELKRELNFILKLGQFQEIELRVLSICITVCIFTLKLSSRLGFGDEIELSLGFWGHWVARIQARAPFQSGNCDSYRVLNVLEGPGASPRETI